MFCQCLVYTVKPDRLTKNGIGLTIVVMIKSGHIVFTVGAVLFLRYSPLLVALLASIALLYGLVYGRVVHRTLLLHPASARGYGLLVRSWSRLWRATMGTIMGGLKRAFVIPSRNPQVVVVQRIEGYSSKSR